ncbi:hypothetical protein MUP77_08625 [Candidatus Bathyarchaeota archaeon]|nr:hypothetical protein [Candidatus Bathyarchaeota archaeon]
MVSRRYVVVEKPRAHIKDAPDEELSYIAALIDGEGSMDIKRWQPRISVTMKSLEPSKLGKKYGRYWYVRTNKRYGSVYYLWYIQGRPLIDDFIDRVGRYSRVKPEQFKLLHDALRILDKQPRVPEWKEEIRKIDNQLKELHHKNPTITPEAACYLDEKQPGWREWVRPGTVIERKP